MTKEEQIIWEYYKDSIWVEYNNLYKNYENGKLNDPILLEYCYHGMEGRFFRDKMEKYYTTKCWQVPLVIKKHAIYKKFMESLGNNKKLQVMLAEVMKDGRCDDDEFIQRTFKHFNEFADSNNAIFYDGCAFDIWIACKEYVFRKLFQQTSNEERAEYIIVEMGNLRTFYNPDKPIEDYIKQKLINELPPIKNLKEGVAFGKEILKKYLPTATGKMPSWIQNCEWPLDKNGEPMIFMGSKKLDVCYYEYHFKSEKTGETITIEQSD